MTSGKSFGKSTKSFGESRKTLAHSCPLLPTIGKSFSRYRFGYLTETLALLPRKVVRDGGLSSASWIHRRYGRPPRCGPGIRPPSARHPRGHDRGFGHVRQRGVQGVGRAVKILALVTAAAGLVVVAAVVAVGLADERRYRRWRRRPPAA